MKEGVAVFDFDETLIRQESVAMFLQALSGRGYVSACCVASMKAALAASWQQRCNIFRTEILRRTLSGRTVAQVYEAAECVFARLDWVNGALTELFRHYDDGHSILIATGSLSVYMPIFLTLKGIHASGLLSTEVKIDKNVLTGEMETPFCTWLEKARRVKQWLLSRTNSGPTWGYGNLPHDRAMLDLTDYPTVVFPWQPYKPRYRPDCSIR